MITEACKLYGCDESTDPRHAGRCVRCNSPLAPAPPVMPAYLRRDTAQEREITYEAARGVCDPDKLILHAETRARTLSGEYVDDPSLILPGRDRLRDAREELADGRNHLVWWIQAHIGDERAQDALECLTLICAAYDKLCENP